MIQVTVGFIVYGAHKDGLKDPMGTPFVDDALIEKSKKALTRAGIRLEVYPTVIASREEARAAMKQMKDDDQIDAVVLFSGTWVWAAHLVAAIRDFAGQAKVSCSGRIPGSQGWRPVGGLVLHGGLLEIGVPHKFVYGDSADAGTIESILSYARAAHLKNLLEPLGPSAPSADAAWARPAARPIPRSG